MTKEALKLALEAMGLAKHSHGVLLLSDPPQEAWKTYQVDAALSKAITAIKEALAQPEHEPVTLDVSGLTGSTLIPANWKSCAPIESPSPQRPSRSDIKPLTDEEIAKEFYKFEAAGAWYQFARAIEAAHGIKE